MPDFGLLPTGLSIPTIQELRADFESNMRDEFGSSIPLGDRTWLGHLIGIVSERLGLCWEGVEAVNSSQDPDKAIDAALRVLGKLTGTFEIAASPSKVTLTLVGDDGTVVAPGFTAKTLSTSKQFATTVDEEGTLAQLDDWVALGDYDVDDRVTNSARSYQCITAGAAAGTGGPSTTDPDITDGTVHWIYLGEGQAVADLKAESVDNGPIEAVAGDITVIDTPTGGVNSCVNLEDADLGRDAMTNEEFRVFRENELAKPGNGVPDAIRAAMLELAGVTNCTVFFNNTDETDGDGMPPHSVEVLVQGGADQDIWDAMWASVPVGITQVGDGLHEGTAVDAEGFDQPVRFSRPEEIDIWVIVTIEEYSKEYGGDPAVKDAIVAWGDEQKTGKNAVASAVAAQAFAVAGVLDVSSVLIGLVDPPTLSTTIAISRRQLAVYDTSRITVNTSEGEP